MAGAAARLNMYDLPPCPKCGSEYLAPYQRGDVAMAECDDCGYSEPCPPGHYAWGDEDDGE